VARRQIRFAHCKSGLPQPDGAGDRVLPISTNRVRRVFDDCLKLAGIGKPLASHALRHTFATRVLEVTEGLAVVQDLLGHAPPATTRVYRG